MTTQQLHNIEHPDYIYGAPLMQSRNGGKVHFQGCGQRSLNARMLKDTDTLTRAELVEKFGTDLCRFCFPELQNIAPLPKIEKKPEDDVCPGSGTWDWEGGKPVRNRYGGHGNGGYCAHCGQWAAVAGYASRIRKHRIKK